MDTVQGLRTANGFILITGIEGTGYAARQNAVVMIHEPTNAGTRPSFSYAAGM